MRTLRIDNFLRHEHLVQVADPFMILLDLLLFLSVIESLKLLPIHPERLQQAICKLVSDWIKVSAIIFVERRLSLQVRCLFRFLHSCILGHIFCRLKLRMCLLLVLRCIFIIPVIYKHLSRILLSFLRQLSLLTLELSMCSLHMYRKPIFVKFAVDGECDKCALVGSRLIKTGE